MSAPLSTAQLSWGFRREQPLGRQLDLTVARGSALAVVGPNGAGKSTLLRTIAGVVPALAGEIRLGGEALGELTAAQRACRVAFLPQTQQPHGELTVRELVALGRTPHLGLWGHVRARDREATERALEWCGLGGLARRPLHAISGGERQRARVAMTVAQEAAVLLLDEPSAHLDLRRRHELYGLLRRLREDLGVAVVLVLHELTEAYREAERVLVLAGGEAAELAPEGRREGLAAAFDVPLERIPPL